MSQECCAPSVMRLKWRLSVIRIADPTNFESYSDLRGCGSGRLRLYFSKRIVKQSLIGDFCPLEKIWQYFWRSSFWIERFMSCDTKLIIVLCVSTFHYM